MENKILLCLGIVNIIISILCCIVLTIKKERSKGFILSLFILLCPVIGASFLFLSWGLRKLFYKKDIDVGDLSFHTDKLEMIVGPDFEKEINIVPVEEALLISDNDDKRRVILDVLKEDYSNSLSVITNALESDDSETSHYVATVIADVKSNFKITVQKMQENLSKYPNDPEISCLLINYIHDFLEKKVLSEIEELTYINQFVLLMNKLYQYHKDAIQCEMYKHIIYYLISIRKSNDAQIWGLRVLEEYPNELDAYKGILKLYFETGEKVKFFDVITRLKKSSVDFDNESLELVRFYQM